MKPTYSHSANATLQKHADLLAQLPSLRDELCDAGKYLNMRAWHHDEYRSAVGQGNGRSGWAASSPAGETGAVRREMVTRMWPGLGAVVVEGIREGAELGRGDADERDMRYGC